MTRTHSARASLLALSGLLWAPIAGATRAQAAEAAKSLWKTTASVGAALTRGNSDTVTATAALNSERKWAQNEFFLGASVTYGETDDTITAANAAGFLQYNRLVSERLYGFVRTDALHDDVADIAYRLTFSGASAITSSKPKSSPPAWTPVRAMCSRSTTIGTCATTLRSASG